MASFVFVDTDIRRGVASILLVKRLSFAGNVPPDPANLPVHTDIRRMT
jgi:hypothetical protein